jgi:hypothetical protein
VSEFSELIKNFDKIRDYMRDFFVYGFKARGDFSQKSSRTYDNEKRRIESYLGAYIKWDTTKGSKRVFISLDSSKINENPLYSAWKSKSFTANDIMLHFFIVDILSAGKCLKIDELTNCICDKYDVCFDTQTVRIKANEYVKEGILLAYKNGKAFSYKLSGDCLNNITQNYNDIIDAISYYQEAVPLGVIGSYLLDNEGKKNNIFKFKHHFVVHTLEDKILFMLLKAMKERRKIVFVNQSKKYSKSITYYAIPLKVFVSCQSGRRYITVYNEKRCRYVNYRLDYVKSVDLLEECAVYDYLKQKLEDNLDKCFGVSFGGNCRGEKISIKIYINEETESYIINRIKREGRGGEFKKVDTNVFLYSKDVFDTNEMMPWVKSFTGRIISVEGTSKFVVDKFYNDMRRMYKMYVGGEN